jgi:hypothetical protein
LPTIRLRILRAIVVEENETFAFSSRQQAMDTKQQKLILRIFVFFGNSFALFGGDARLVIVPLHPQVRKRATLPIEPACARRREHTLRRVAATPP